MMADDPRGLTVLGFVAIADPLRAAVPDAIRRCLAAGVRVIMLTGDHPATARAIAAARLEQTSPALKIGELTLRSLGEEVVRDAHGQVGG